VRGIVDRSTDPDLLRTELFIDGEWTSGCRDRIEIREPATGDVLGLAAYFFTRDLGRVRRVGEALEFGAVGINTGLISYEGAPFGGVQESCVGREGSRHGTDGFTELTYLCIDGLTHRRNAK
jgi:Aldehyde dehydrogenase family